MSNRQHRHSPRSCRHDHRKHVEDWFHFEGYSFSRKQLIELKDGDVIQCENIKIQCIDRFIHFTINGKQALYNKHQRDGSIYADEQRDKEERTARAIKADNEPANDNECLEVIEDEYSYRDACLIRSNWKRWR